MRRRCGRRGAARSISIARSTAGSTSSASSCMKRGVRGRGGGSESPWPKREKAITRAPVASASAAGKSRHSRTDPSPSCSSTSGRSVTGEVEDLEAAALELDPRHEQKPAGPAPTIAVLLLMPPERSKNDEPLTYVNRSVLEWRAPRRGARRSMSIVSPERVNVSRLLDHNLEAGRADKPALLGEFGTLTFADVARLTARTAALLARAGRGPRGPRDDGSGRLARLPRDVPRSDPYRRGADPGQPDGPHRQLRLLPGRQLREGARRRRCAPGQGRAGAGGPPRAARARRQRRSARTHELRRQPWPRSPTNWSRRPTRTRTTWRSGSTARARRAGRRVSSTPIATSARRSTPTRATCSRSPRTTSATRRPSSSTPTGSATACRSRCRPAPRPCSCTARPGRIASSRRSRASPPRCSSRSRRCTRRCSRPRRSRTTDFSSARACISAAEPLSAAVSERWLAQTGVPILDGIGSTEMLHIYCSNTLEDLRPGTSGTPVPGYDLRVIDEHGQDARAGRAGRPAGPRRELCRLLLAPAGEDAPLHARRLVLHRRPLRPDPGRPLRLPGPGRRHDQGRRPVGRARRRRGLPDPPSRRLGGGGDRRHARGGQPRQGLRHLQRGARRA